MYWYIVIQYVGIIHFILDPVSLEAYGLCSGTLQYGSPMASTNHELISMQHESKSNLHCIVVTHYPLTMHIQFSENYFHIR